MYSGELYLNLLIFLNSTDVRNEECDIAATVNMAAYTVPD